MGKLDTFLNEFPYVSKLLGFVSQTAAHIRAQKIGKIGKQTSFEEKIEILQDGKKEILAAIKRLFSNNEAQLMFAKIGKLPAHEKQAFINKVLESMITKEYTAEKALLSAVIALPKMTELTVGDLCKEHLAIKKATDKELLESYKTLRSACLEFEKLVAYITDARAKVKSLKTLKP